VSFRLLGSARLGHGVFLELERLHLLAADGRAVRRDVVRHPGGVAVLVVDGADTWLVRQYRAPFRTSILEIPAGRFDRPGEDPAAAAARELGEELGLSARRLVPLGSMLVSPGYTDEVIHLFAADGVSAGERRPDGVEEELAEIVTLPLAEAYRMADRGELRDAKTIVALGAWSRRRP